jgi:hypothetical protein
MNSRTPIVFVVVLGLPLAARADADWALVPASREARSLDSFAVPDIPAEKFVRYIGPIPLPSPLEEPRPVVSFGISAPQEGLRGKRQIPKAADYSIPVGAHWPDSNGRISGLARSKSNGPGMRNPWEVRAPVGRPRADTVFTFGGVVAGGDGGPVGILNGRVVRQGDSLGSYRVAGILATDLVLEAGGSYFVVPRGARTTISATRA